MRKIIIVLCVIFAMQAYAYAEEVGFQISLDKNKVRPGRRVILSMVFTGTNDIPQPSLPVQDNLTFTYSGSQIGKTTVKDNPVDSITYFCKVVSAKAGTFPIGPISFQYKGNTYISNVISLEVSMEVEKEETKAPSPGAAEGFAKKIFAVLSVPKKEIFVNEMSSLNVEFYTDWVDLELSFPQHTGASFAITGNFVMGETRHLSKDGINYLVMDWKQWFYAPEPGEYAFDPISMDMKVMRRPKGVLPPERDMYNNNNADFYDNFIGSVESRTISVTTSANSIDGYGTVKIKVVPLPAGGRPKDFKGAVGSFAFDAKIDSTSVKIGDVLTLTGEISGHGNYYTVTIPDIGKIDGVKLYDPQIQRETDRIKFTQIMKIQSDAVTEIPKMSFSFFDPAVREYMSLAKGPFPVEVKKAAGKEGGKEPEKKAAVNIVYIKESPGAVSAKADPYFYRTGIFIILQILPLLILGAVVTVKKRVDLVMSNLPYARWLRASRRSDAAIARAQALIDKNDAKGFYDTVFDIMQDYFGERFAVPPGGITENTAGSFIKDKKVFDYAAGKIVDIFSECYRARFSVSELKKEEMAGVFQKVKDVIEYLNSKKEL